MSVAIIKIIGIIAISALLCLPFLPFDRFFTFYAKSYKGTDRRNNLVFVVATCIEVFFISWFAPLVMNLINWIKGLGFVEWISKKIPDRIEYIIDAITLLSVNLLLCIAFLGIKKLVRTFLNKKVFTEAADLPLIKKEKKTWADKKSKAIKKKEFEDKKIVSLRNHSVLIFGRLNSKKGVVSVDSENNDFTYESHTTSGGDVNEHAVDEENLSKLQKFWYKLVGIVYDKKSGYVYIKPNTYRLAMELKIFTHILLGLYIVACILVLVPVFFSFSALPGFYKIAGFIINNTFFYPVLTLAVLFEILYYVDGEAEELELPQENFLSVASGRTEKKEVDLPELKNEIMEGYGEKYDIIHCDIAASNEKSVYKPKESKREVMKRIHDLIQKRYGAVNNRFLEGIEYMLDGKNVLFDSSFYSSLGDYIVNYLFIHLTFGNRALFICKDEKEKDNLRSYLTESTKEIIKSPVSFWRIGDYKSVHAGELPDILILVPEDFSRKSLFSDGKTFFDELVDVFVPDVDDIISANNYYCVIMAKKLEKVDDFRKLVTMFVRDNPEVFWWQDMKGVMNHDGDGNMTSYLIKYTLSAEGAEKRKAKIEKAIAPFVGGITVSMSDYDVALKAFENIVDLIDYDTLTLNEEHAGRISSDAPDDIRSIYGVFVDKKAVCAGYARAYQFLLNRMGIECTYVVGKCHEGGSHAWNLIKLEGDYYYVDVTWGDSSNTDKSMNSGRGISYDYFCITTDELLRTRDIREAAIYPVCTAVKCNYHYRNGLYFKSFDADKFRKILTDAVKQGKKHIPVKLETKALYDFVLNRMVTCGGARDIIVEAGGKGGSAYVCKKLYIIDFEL